MQFEQFIKNEEKRQRENIELIASENFVSDRIKKATGSVLTNKYAEGYPEQESIDEFTKMFPDYTHTGAVGRYYGGCKNVDMVELYARYMWQKAFNTNYHVNVQPHSGSQANFAMYQALIKPGDTILAMSLENGGHLTHGSSANFSGKLYNIVFYNVDKDGYIDYEDIREKILECGPQIILAGASAYPRKIDFKKIYDIINECKKRIGDGYEPYFCVDMAHIAGLIVAGDHPSPFGLADVITTTTHKTLRGPRGGMIFCKPELAKKIDSAVFPNSQGGPLEHVIAGKAICAEEACTDEYKEYIHRVVENCNAMAEEFKKLGYKVTTGGTDNHLLLLDFSETHPNISGRMVQDECDKYNITLNKNCVPREKRKPKETSGVRIGTAAMTTKGYTKEDFKKIARKIDEIIRSL